MQLTLFKALQSIRIRDDQATAVVESVEAYMANTVADAVKGLET